MIDEILLFVAKKVGHAGGGEHIYIYIFMAHRFRVRRQRTSVTQSSRRWRSSEQRWTKRRSGLEGVLFRYPV